MDEYPGVVLDAEAVAHVEPLTDDQLNQQISDTMPELFKRFHEIGQRIATEFGMNGSDAIALLKLDAPMTMKELGQRMACDPSFVTSIADALEKHGLARREPSLKDRRSKNIVLTPEGEAVPRDPGPGPVVHGARHQRAPVPARADAEDAPIAVREVRLSQIRRLFRLFL
jgi:DNA-binding MarR family transcriptional regulator